MKNWGAVVVTYNRLEKLKNALEAYKCQEFYPRYFLVVDNHSTDGTAEYLEGWKLENPSVHRVLSLQENLGGSGGFYLGLQYAMEHSLDWIWISDDDAYPQPDCFSALAHYLTEHDSLAISAACAAVVNSEGIDDWHRRKLKIILGIPMECKINIAAYSQPFPIDVFSYVGTMLNCSALQSAGLPNKNFFIGYDDSEHSIRMAKEGDLVCVPEARVFHDAGVSSNQLTWKNFYILRNKLYSYRLHFGIFAMYTLGLYHYIKSLFTSRENHRMFCAAFHDARKGILGINGYYGPNS